jgi:hypothetical protein
MDFWYNKINIEVKIYATLNQNKSGLSIKPEGSARSMLRVNHTRGKPVLPSVDILNWWHFKYHQTGDLPEYLPV